jgi:hypothetical protein
MLTAADHEVWRVAQKEQRALATINGGDFQAFAKGNPAHFGLVVIPSGGTRAQQLSYVMSAVTYVRATNDPGRGFWGLHLEVDIRGQTVVRQLEIR